MRITLTLLATLIALNSLLLSSCASIEAPTGGPKDIQPPVLLKAEPENKTTNFNSSVVTLQFDEYFDLKDAFNQVVISPPMTIQPELSVKGKKLLIKFKEDLKEDRTYTIRFGDAIQDITEKNVLKNFQYVFATGDLIDSLTTGGKLKDAQTNEPVADVLVMLYPTEEFGDSTVYLERPYYFSKTTEDGSYSISNIKEGSYCVFALIDQNFNYLYDLPNESIGYIDTAIQIDTIPVSLALSLFTEESNTAFQKFRSAKAERFGQIRFAFSSRIEEGTIEVTNTSGNFTYSVDKDTSFFWFSELSLDSISYRVKYGAVDTLRNVATRQIADSLMQKKKLKIASNIKASKPQKGSNQLEKTKPVSFDLGQQVELNFNSPLSKWDQERVVLTEDSLDIEVPLAAKLDSSKQQLSLNCDWKNNTHYKLKIKKGFAEDIYGLKSDTLTYLFKTKSKDDYGTLKIRILADSTSQHIIELMDQAGQLIQTHISKGSNSLFELGFLSPGNYSLRAIVDLDKNGKWTSGNYAEKRQPEETILYLESINLRPNWEMEVDWEMGKTN